MDSDVVVWLLCSRVRRRHEADPAERMRGSKVGTVSRRKWTMKRATAAIACTGNRFTEAPHLSRTTMTGERALLTLSSGSGAELLFECHGTPTETGGSRRCDETPDNNARAHEHRDTM
jgi:hypothetical protein